MVHIGNDWDEILREEFAQSYYQELRQFLIREYRGGTVYPPMEDIYNAFRYTPYASVRAVILGQDPYHEPGQAHGLAFSVRPGVRQPPSLVNILQELRDDLGIEPPPADNGCLIPWANAGVLLLNTVLTVRAHQAGSHRGRGWEQLTDAVIRKLNERAQPMVFLLWGTNAKSKLPLLTNRRHLVITGPHPSPLSVYRGFYGGKYFSRTNDFLERQGEAAIDWRLDGAVTAS